MSIAEYCFVSSMLTILGLILLISGVMALIDIISAHKFKKQERKNREKFVDWLMLHFDDPNHKLFDSILNNDEFCYIGNDGKVYSLYTLNDSLCDCVRKRGEEEK